MAIRKEDLAAMPDINRNYTHEEYMNIEYINENPRLELIDGQIYFMAAPNRAHQEVSSNLQGTIWNFLKGKKCQIFAAPFAVNLEQGKGHDTTVQPDLVVVCDPNKLDKKGCNGTPDMVIEILSPSTTRKDRLLKYLKYEQAGVAEYWIVDPDGRFVEVYLLQDGRYFSKRYGEEDKIPCDVLEGLEIDLNEIFPPEDKGLEQEEQHE